MKNLTIAFVILFSSLNLYSQFGASVEIVNQREVFNLFVDFDLDGDRDIVGFGENITLFTNDGTANFNKSHLTNDWVLNTPSGPNIASCDLNNDGFPDFLFHDSDESQLIVYYNQNGQGIASEEVIYTGAVGTIQCIDVNVDGNNDIVWKTSFYSTSFVALLNQGNGQFSAQTYVFSAIIESFCDWDFDGDTDILTRYGSDYYAVYNDGTGNYNDTIAITLGVVPQNIKIVDIDNDNDADILYTGTAFNSNTLLNVVRNTNNVQFEPEETSFLGTPINTVSTSITDLNNDGYLDALLWGSSSYCGYSLNQGDGTYGSAQNLNLPPSPGSSITNGFTSLADFNGDGIVDILTVNEWLFLSNGILSYEPRRRVQGPISGPMRLLDVNSDTLEDLVYVSDTYLCYQEGIGDTILSTTIDTLGALSGYPYSMNELFACDINQDGLNDIVYRMPIPSWSAVRGFINNGNGTFSALQIANLSNVYSMKVADIDGDNFPDIVYTNVTGLYWRKNLGNLTFSSAVNLANNTYDGQFECADLDEDQDIDILLTIDLASGYEMLYLPNSGSGIYGTPIQIDLQSMGSSNTSKTIVDVNADGFLDIALHHSVFNVLQSDEYHFIYLGDGTGNYSLYDTPGSFQSTDMEVADINHDGRLDFLGGTGSNLFAHFQLQDGTFTDALLFDELIEVSIGQFAFYGQNNDLIHHDYNKSGIFKAENHFENYLMGEVFVDENSNAILDTNENAVPNHAIQNLPNSNYSYSNEEGQYFFYDLFDDQNEVSPASLPFFQSTTISPYIFLNTSQNDSVYEYDFGFVSAQLADSINISLTGGASQCSFSTNYWLNLSNIGGTEPSGVIEMVIDTQVVYVSSSVTPDSIVGQHLYWRYDSLSYFQDTMIVVEVEMPDFNSMGDTLQSYVVAHITDGLGGIVFSDTDTLNQILTCAYDPNDKTAIPAGVGSNGYIPLETDWLEYIVRFQNTGNDTAIHVILTDQLDSKFDWGSLQLIASSHPVNITISTEGLASFAHNFIYLPDSLTDETGSQGFVRYKLRIRNEAQIEGAKIYNSASIYFDYNPPIITNTTINTFYTCSTVLTYQIPIHICIGDTLNASINMGINTGSIVWNYDNDNATGEQFSVPVTLVGETPLNVSISGDLCSSDTTFLISVTDLPVVTIDSSAQLDYCQSNELLNLPMVTPVNGVWSGENIIGQQFIPQQIGTYEYSYHFTNLQGCSNSDTIQINVIPGPTVIITPSGFDTLCPNYDAFTLNNALPEGGIWYGESVLNGQFYPNLADIGSNWIYYSYTDSNACQGTDSLEIFVDACLALDEMNEDVFLVYPNPVTFFINIQPTDQQALYSIKMIDVSGSEVMFEENLTGMIHVPTQNLASGFYNLIVIDSVTGNRINYKIVKE